MQDTFACCSNGIIEICLPVRLMGNYILGAKDKDDFHKLLCELIGNIYCSVLVTCPCILVKKLLIMSRLTQVGIFCGFSVLCRGIHNITNGSV
jgi:hypothetical protein